MHHSNVNESVHNNQNDHELQEQDLVEALRKTEDTPQKTSAANLHLDMKGSGNFHLNMLMQMRGQWGSCLHVLTISSRPAVPITLWF